MTLSGAYQLFLYGPGAKRVQQERRPMTENQKVVRRLWLKHEKTKHRLKTASAEAGMGTGEFHSHIQALRSKGWL